MVKTQGLHKAQSSGSDGRSSLDSDDSGDLGRPAFVRQHTQSLWADHQEGMHRARPASHVHTPKHPEDRVEPEEARHLGLKAVSVAYLKAFAAQNRIRSDTSTAQVVKNIIRPATAASKCAMVDLPELAPHMLPYGAAAVAALAVMAAADGTQAPRLSSGGGRLAKRPPYYFVIHTRSRPFMEIVNLVSNHFKGRALETVYVWLDVFAVTQHEENHAILMSEIQRAIWYSECSLLCLDSAGTALTRLWCLYEMFYTLSTKASSRTLVVLTSATLSYKAQAALYRKLDAHKAKCAVKADRHVLNQVITAQTRRGYAAVNNYVKSGMLLPPYDHQSVVLQSGGAEPRGCLPCLSVPPPEAPPLPKYITDVPTAASPSQKGGSNGKPLRLLMGACNIPHPAKAHRGGEDAFFVSGAGRGALGVADGVGSWSSDDGIDPALYSRDIMLAAAKVLEEHNGAVAAREVLSSAHLGVKHAGSCTACVAHVPPDKNTMQVVNLGDSGLRLIRGGSVAMATRPQCHSHNLPYQLACPDEPVCDTDGAVQADVYSVILEAGDVIIMATDGVFDNMWPEQMNEIVAQVLEAGSAYGPPSPNGSMADLGVRIMRSNTGTLAPNGKQQAASYDHAAAPALPSSPARSPGQSQGGQPPTTSEPPSAAMSSLATTLANHAHITAAGDAGERIQANASPGPLPAEHSSALAAAIARTLARTAASNMLKSDFKSPFAVELSKLDSTPFEFKIDPKGGKPDDVTVVVAIAVPQ